MREIKFRAWNKRLKKLVSMEEFVFSPCFIQADGKVIICDPGNEEHNFEELEDYILMQYTGLKDKNGKEIYEGDIIKYKYEKSLRGDISKVEWQNEYAGFSPFVDYDSDNQWSYINLESIEVISNIYENPKLLEEEK